MWAIPWFSCWDKMRRQHRSGSFVQIWVWTSPFSSSLATFRRRFLGELEGLFVQVLEYAQEMKLLKLGTVCLDGTKIHANASRHSALSHGHIEKLETQLKAEVAELFALAESADQADIPDGVSLPDEIKRRDERLALVVRLLAFAAMMAVTGAAVDSLLATDIQLPGLPKIDLTNPYGDLEKMLEQELK